MKKKQRMLLVMLFCFTLLLSGGTIVLAEDDASSDDEVMLEEVVVTGSRIAREKGFGQTSPVTVMGKEDIDSFGLTRIEDVLNTMPQIETGQSAFIANGSTGTATVDLRGLGPARTLVLMNGRRMQPGGTNTQFVDVNQIPSAMLERVEVLTGGASATYGADAVAGVVNFIMRKMDGIELSIGGSGYQHDNNNSYMQGLMDDKGYDYPTGNSGLDGKSYDVDIVMGSDFAGGRGNATVYAAYRQNDELLESERDYSSCALSDSGTRCSGSSTAIVPNFFIHPLTPDTATGDPDWPSEIWYSLQPDSSLAYFDGTNTYNYAPVNHFQRPDKRWSAGGFFDYEINEKAKAYMEVQYFNDRSRSQIAYSGTFYAMNHSLPLSYFPEAMQASLAEDFPDQEWFNVQIGKRNVEGGPRVEITDHSSFRIVGGLKGSISENWDYDVSYLRGQTTSSSTYMNDFYKPLVDAAINPECAADADCIGYDVFTYNGVTAEMAAGLTAIGISNNVTSIESVSGVVNGDTGFGMAAGNITVATGFEWREERYEDIRDYPYEAGLLMGQGGPRPSLTGSFNVLDFFGEANVPLVADVPLIEELTMNLALRYSDHSITDSATTYRAGLDWKTNDMLRFRMGYNRAVRSPNIEELFEVEYVNLWYGSDPCALDPFYPEDGPAYTAEQCARTGLDPSLYGVITGNPAYQYNHMRGGNTNLEPEEADTFTFGVVVEPLEKRLKMSLDYWNIDIDKTIDRIGAALILDMCALDGQLCDYVHRSESGSLWQTEDGYIYNIMYNLGKLKTSGIDLAGTYWLEALQGTWNFNLVGTYTIEKETTPLADDPSTAYECAGKISLDCFPTPKWRHTASVTYDSMESWTATARWRFYSSVDNEYTADTIANLKSTSYFDLSGTYRFMENSDIMLGINNVLDKEPPLVGSSLAGWGNANTISGYYDTLGRYIFTKATFRF